MTHLEREPVDTDKGEICAMGHSAYCKMAAAKVQWVMRTCRVVPAVDAGRRPETASIGNAQPLVHQAAGRGVLQVLPGIRVKMFLHCKGGQGGFVEP